jgi:hypothetical protein
MAIEVVQALTHDKVEFRFRGSLHLLVAYEEGIRSNGETLIEGLPRSTLRDVKRKLAFVPAGHEYREWQEPRTRGRIVYFYFDPAKTPLAPSAGAAGTALAPRLFFEDNTPWETAVKMAALIENGAENRQYCEALGVVLAHELVRRNAGARRVEPPARGGLAGWQQRIVAAYIEDHIAEHVPLATLARFVRLSAYHFCRAFKRSFGMPPHRYHNARRIEHAKMLLAQPTCSVTEIALKRSALAKRVPSRQPFARRPGPHRPRIVEALHESRESAVTRHLIAVATAILVSSSCAYAQVRGSTPAPAVPTTSPFGMSTSGTAVAPTGIPLGAAPLATPGVSSGTSNGVASATACSSPGVGSTMTGTSGSTAQFDASGVGVMTGATLPGAAAPITTTCSPTSATGSAAASQSSTSTPATSQLGVPTIPIGSTELSNPGLSPAPCPATGNTASTSSGAC